MTPAARYGIVPPAQAAALSGRELLQGTKVNFSRAIRADTGRVRAEARVVSKGRQIISAEADVKSQDGRVLAHGTSTLLVLQDAAQG